MPPAVLILSSFVAASRVGGGAQAMVLARLGLEPILVPSVQLGRHPGFGAPGGKPVEPQTMASMLKGIDAQGTFQRLAAVITGYFALADQVAVAADAIAMARSGSPDAMIVVDPIMGDAESGLYVREAVAAAIEQRLVQRADLVAPNAWELARLIDAPVQDAEAALRGARELGRPVLVSSVPADAAIGTLYVDTADAFLALHPRARTAPKGTGDLLTALFTAARVSGRGPRAALSAAVGGVADAVALAGDAHELPVGAMPLKLAPSKRVRIARL
ncbi:MAG TPA: bifunctional hydroxymethylpyrimidine kinase/phosphomethylpyrimidine kinase [Caulobacteraceae bacterium]|nr:bifunctional hydroxymethylpyrimidine kinase/phosphomethylpyrimidine kinase [Caulobacteraceae bacterium]